MKKTIIFETLDALFDLALRSEPATMMALETKAGAHTAQIRSALLHLESRGLVDARALRLTMRGLTAAVALRGHAHHADVPTRRAA